MNDQPTSPRVVDRVSERAVDGLRELFGPAEPATLFSAPVAAGGDLVFTAAAWERIGGFGFGGGSGADDAGGGGAGGGGTSIGRPVAVIRVGPGGIVVKPVVDVTKVAVTVALAALGVWRVLRR